MATGGDQYDFTGAVDMVDTQIPIRDALVSELKSVQNLNYTYEASLINGESPVLGDSEEETALANLPKTGSSIDTYVLVVLGSMITFVGVALFMANRKKEEEEVA
jgi:LPXTG-motif cell wall-anchored protein